MPLDFYSPNAKNDGGALFVTSSSKDQALYFKILKQTAWDPANKKGTFKGGKTTNIKLSRDEVGGILSAIRSRGGFSFYHSSDDRLTTGTLTYYELDVTNKAGKPEKRKGFGLKVKGGDVEFKVGLSLGSAEVLAEYLVFFLHRVFGAIYQLDKEEWEKYQASKNKEKSKEHVEKASNPPDNAPTDDSPPEEDIPF